jgi:hypothetical protein
VNDPTGDCWLITGRRERTCELWTLVGRNGPASLERGGKDPLYWKTGSEDDGALGESWK